MKPSSIIHGSATAWISIVIFAWVGAAGWATAAEIDAAKLPPPAHGQVVFEEQIKPLFENRCYRCHGPERPRSGFRLDLREAAIKGGDNGVDIIPGQSAKSPLIHYVARLVEGMEMPPAGKGEPLSAQEVGLLRAWIDQGAEWDDSGTKSKTLFSIQPSFAWIDVSGNRQQFREQWGMNDGWSGGIQELRLQETTPAGVKLEADGRLLFEQNDYRIGLRLEKKDLGFVRFGFEQFRKYFDDTGGFYEPFATNTIGLRRDLYLDVGRAWFDIGLTLPRWPRIVLGYEYEFRDGSRSSLAWSDVRSPTAPGAFPVSIYPSFKQLDEQVHVVKLDASYEFQGATLEDSFRAEFYDLNSRRTEYFPVPLGASPTAAGRFQEDYRHFQAVNAFRVEKQLKDWLLLGGGYLYSKLDGDGGFTRDAFRPATMEPIGSVLDASSPIVVTRESHIYNISSLWGPWEGLALSAAVQNEWTHEEGFGQGLIRVLNPMQPGVQHDYDSQRDKAILQEDVGLRYTRIPFTVLYADARFRQEWIDHFERDEFSLERLDFLRDTDARLDRRQFKTGFTLSPWRRLSLDASYRYTLQGTDYDHQRDENPGPAAPNPVLEPPNGYPAFFRRREIQSDEFDVRLIVHPATWLKSTLRYQLVAADYTTVTDPNILTGMGTVLPGGEILAGNYDAHIYSLSTTLTPWKRLLLSTTLSYSDTRTVSGVNGRTGVGPYRGDIYSLLSSANFVVSNSTDWNLSYTFSHANYHQERASQILPLGIQYDRHGLIAGVTRRFGKNVQTNLQYGFFRFDEPTSGRARDYTAHGVFASVKVLFD